MVEQTFFQIAAALIPTLLFGGLIAERLRPPDRSRWSRRRTTWGSMLATLLVPFFLLAEIFAIVGALYPSGYAGDFTTGFVVAAIVLGTVLIGIALLVPWITAVDDARERRIMIWGTVALVVVACGGGGGFVLFQSIDTARTAERLDAYNERLAQEASKLSGRTIDPGNLAEVLQDETLLQSQASTKRVYTDLFRAARRLNRLLLQRRITRSEARAEIALELDVALAQLSPVAKRVLRGYRPLFVRFTVPPP